MWYWYIEIIIHSTLNYEATVIFIYLLTYLTIVEYTKAEIDYLFL